MEVCRVYSRKQPSRGASANSTEPDVTVTEYMRHDRLAGTPCVVTSSYYNSKWAAGTDGKYFSGQMFVENLSPSVVRQKHNIVLVHGDFQSGHIWLTKPDGMPGWAAYFLKKGYRVYLPDLPGSGRSPFLNKDDYLLRDISNQCQSMSVKLAESQITAPEKQPLIEGHHAWPTAPLHNMWPGTGQRGDRIFEQFMSSMGTLTLLKPEREALAQIALQDLLKSIGPSILIGHGTGCTAAWLAADAVPELVVKVVAVEPAGPPCAKAFMNLAGGQRLYTPYLMHDQRCRKYGLSEIPLTFSPPARTPTGPDSQALDITARQLPDNSGCYMAQAIIPGFHIRNRKPGQEAVPQLVQLKRMPHAIITGHASFHSVFDWATVLFLRQAGVSVDFINLGDRGIFGNGNMMFLEKNSDQIADLVTGWIESHGTQNPQISHASHQQNANANAYAPGNAPGQPIVIGQGPSLPPQIANPSTGLPQPTQAMQLAQHTSMAGNPEPGVAAAQAGSQIQVQTRSNGVISPNYDPQNMSGQGQQGANLSVAPLSAPKAWQRALRVRQRSEEQDDNHSLHPRKRRNNGTNGSEAVTYRTEALAQQNVSQQSMPEQSMAQQSMAQQSMPEQSTPEQSMPEQSMPEQIMPEQIMPQQSMLQQIMPEQNMPQQIMPLITPESSCASLATDIDQPQSQYSTILDPLDMTAIPNLMTTQSQTASQSSMIRSSPVIDSNVVQAITMEELSPSFTPNPRFAWQLPGNLETYGTSVDNGNIGAATASSQILQTLPHMGNSDTGIQRRYMPNPSIQMPVIAPDMLPLSDTSQQNLDAAGITNEGLPLTAHRYSELTELDMALSQQYAFYPSPENVPLNEFGASGAAMPNDGLFQHFTNMKYLN
ncbi:Alpha/beta hydrolase family domain-containing protein [Trichoderma ceciliae]